MRGPFASFYLLAAVVLLLVGCPRDDGLPERPSSARVCASDADCQPDAGPACGVLPACVDRRCEAEPSLLVPCS